MDSKVMYVVRLGVQKAMQSQFPNLPAQLLLDGALVLKTYFNIESEAGEPTLLVCVNCRNHFSSHNSVAMLLGHVTECTK